MEKEIYCVCAIFKMDNNLDEIMNFYFHNKLSGEVTGVVITMGDECMMVIEGVEDVVVDNFMHLMKVKNLTIKYILNQGLTKANETHFADWFFWYNVKDTEDKHRIFGNISGIGFSEETEDSYVKELVKSFIENERIDFSRFWKGE
jgi:hypothetical protein